jgi:hypothetical protein
MKRVVFAALVAALTVPATASAATSTFHRFEVEATANYVVSVACPDGTTVTQRVQVIAGHEEEQQDGETLSDEDFGTVRHFGVDCEGNFFSVRASGPAEFTFSPSLQTASVTGTATAPGGSTYTVDITWEGTGPIESTSNTTTFTGFVGHFVGMERDAVATGTVTVDGRTLVDGTTTNASIETLEDTNISFGQ